MNHLKHIRDYYKVPAHKGGRIQYGLNHPVFGTIIGGKNDRLRVKFDLMPNRTALLHPDWRISYLDSKSP